jgi:hypothetical protein
MNVEHRLTRWNRRCRLWPMMIRTTSRQDTRKRSFIALSCPPLQAGGAKFCLSFKLFSVAVTIGEAGGKIMKRRLIRL